MHRTRNLMAIALILVTAAARADDIGDKGRDIFKKNEHAIVTVQVVLKASYTRSGRSSDPNETKSDVTGTVIDPSGLVVLALSSFDPSDLYRRISEDYKMETDVNDIKILLDDGTEIPAEIVLRDKDLDLAFIRPKTKPASPMTSVDLSKSSPADMLEQVITLNRLNRAAGRGYSASVERISAVIEKPRTFYIPDATMSTTSLGSPAFLPNGDVLGLFVMRAVNSGGSTNPRDSLTTIIIPAEDILKGAKQAPEAKGDSDKPDDTKTNAAPADAKSQK
ncbi:MAG TPA: serine protease [Candidatus Baltobacteraceae bacterium]|nr:serine protease [Candidatus Baltobacteraceae bacterium]